MHGEWNSLLFDLDKLHRAETLRAAEQHRLAETLRSRRSLRRAARAVLFNVGGALVAGGSALQARADDISASLHREEEPAAPQQRHASGY